MNLSNIISLIVMVTWEEFWSPVGDNLTEGVFHGNLLILGAIFFLFILMFILMLRFTVPLVAVIMIPLIFLMASVPGFLFQDMLLILAIIVGIIFGVALIKWYRK